MRLLEYRSPATGNNQQVRPAVSLVEVLAGALVVVGFLYWMSQPPRHTRPGKVRAVKVELSAFRSALEGFRFDVGRYPTSGEGLDALIECPTGLSGRWHGPYLNKIPADPWAHAYVYSSPGSPGHPFTVTCNAPDGTTYSTDHLDCNE